MVRTEGIALLADLDPASRGHHGHRDRGRLWALPQSCEKGTPVGIGQNQLEHDQVETPLTEQLFGLCGGPCRDDLSVVGSEHDTHEVADLGVVFDDEHDP